MHTDTSLTSWQQSSCSYSSLQLLKSQGFKQGPEQQSSSNLGESELLWYGFCCCVLHIHGTTPATAAFGSGLPWPSGRHSKTKLPWSSWARPGLQPCTMPAPTVSVLPLGAAGSLHPSPLPRYFSYLLTEQRPDGREAPEGFAELKEEPICLGALGWTG